MVFESIEFWEPASLQKVVIRDIFTKPLYSYHGLESTELWELAICLPDSCDLGEVI